MQNSRREQSIGQRSNSLFRIGARGFAGGKCVAGGEIKNKNSFTWEKHFIVVGGS
jgi:hypothetical protein